MNYQEALKKAKLGEVLMLPNWIGYFKWDFNKQQLYFINKDYMNYNISDKIKSRNDWYYII